MSLQSIKMYINECLDILVGGGELLCLRGGGVGCNEIFSWTFSTKLQIWVG